MLPRGVAHIPPHTCFRTPLPATKYKHYFTSKYCKEYLDLKTSRYWSCNLKWVYTYRVAYPIHLVSFNFYKYYLIKKGFRHSGVSFEKFVLFISSFIINSNFLHFFCSNYFTFTFTGNCQQAPSPLLIK